MRMCYNLSRRLLRLVLKPFPFRISNLQKISLKSFRFCSCKSNRVLPETAAIYVLCPHQFRDVVHLSPLESAVAEKGARGVPHSEKFTPPPNSPTCLEPRFVSPPASR